MAAAVAQDLPFALSSENRKCYLLSIPTKVLRFLVLLKSLTSRQHKTSKISSLLSLREYTLFERINITKSTVL